VAPAFGRGGREADMVDDCARILMETGLLRKANVVAGSLSLLDRKRLELARALATGPQLLLLDEIAGLTEGECRPPRTKSSIGFGRASLKALPPYRAVLRLERRASHEDMISVGGNLYSVPERRGGGSSTCTSRRRDPHL
jgi:hypothetical protein